jgi:hypothetical protein
VGSSRYRIGWPAASCGPSGQLRVLDLSSGDVRPGPAPSLTLLGRQVVQWTHFRPRQPCQCPPRFVDGSVTQRSEEARRRHEIPPQHPTLVFLRGSQHRNVGSVTRLSLNEPGGAAHLRLGRGNRHLRLRDRWLCWPCTCDSVLLPTAAIRPTLSVSIHRT